MQLYNRKVKIVSKSIVSWREFRRDFRVIYLSRTFQDRDKIHWPRVLVFANFRTGPIANAHLDDDCPGANNGTTIETTKSKTSLVELEMRGRT